MTPLTKSLEKRIQELRSSIEAQKNELAVFEQALALETSKPAQMEAAVPVVAPKVAPSAYKKPAPPTAKAASAPSPATSAGSSGLVFNGSRSDFVAAVLKHGGAGGASPQEISAAFASRKIAISKNLVYNVLSLMFKQKRVRKSNGRYYMLGKSSAPASSSSATASSASSSSSRISEEGRQRIIAATKKRWAAQKAAKR
jgi:hypothetical protein